MTNLFRGEVKNEVAQLRDQLDGNDPSERKNAAKRVVALMRSGENVQSLFSSMLRCVRTSDLELKKLTYLYLVHYSEQEPEQAIMAVNTFVQDSQDMNPLVRALAVRTMCRIKLENVAEHMIIPLKKCLSDQDPYVRKTAAFGVAKLYDVIPEAVENANLFDDLLKLLSDDNPMVVSNTTATIFEINERRTTPIFNLNSDTIGPILSAINSCTEWCQTILLDALSRYKPVSPEDATFLIDRLVPFLKHSNPAVVIGSFKCIFLFMEVDSRKPSKIFPQIIPPFITLVTSAEPEVQYVVLRTLSLFVQKYPRALSKEIRVFFCKYNDPSYVKMEKLDIIVTICRPQNAQLVLDELNEYCNAVDVAFVRKSVRCIGQIAIKMEEASRRCVDILVALVGGKADYAVEEAVCVVCDILRKYPGNFESIISTVCANMEQLKEPRAKAAGIWILGEYCHLIEKVDDILDPYLDTFHDEQPIVQLSILSSIVKVFIQKPDTRDQLQFVLQEATKPGNVPDVKNRAFVYWRVLSLPDLSVAQDILHFDKKTVLHSGVNFDPSILAELIKNMGSVAGVLHVVPSDFVRRVRFVPEDEDLKDDDDTSRIWHPVRLNDNSTLDLFADYDRSHIYLRLMNKSPSALSDFAFALNKNSIGITVSGTPTFPATLEFGDVAEVEVPIRVDPSQCANFDKYDLQIALRTSVGTIFALDKIPAQSATLPEGEIGAENFRQYFASYTATASFIVEDAAVADEKQLKESGIFVVGKNDNKTYISFALPPNCVFVAELTQNQQSIGVAIKGPSPQLFPVIEASARALFAQK
ncbi:Adaptin N terminal region family protein [Tritrichomonas foetus]|uniref:Adaptin N terminal region family protein n=1 Tax=Tritrichomonas foetus TaxID=1144522 RepID=A0A1J4J8Y7_9EUKA|nr:Adaptin N terminal region family protein [Tritrichomonas foetus]|eukprot:OHS95153.1 Adaptin N terminal region family protein [Tritrichomonas foetus]